MLKPILTSFAATLAGSLGLASAHAATISVLDDASDLTLTETVVYAVNVENSPDDQSATIAGVTFVDWTSNAPAGFTLTGADNGSVANILGLSGGADNDALETVLEFNRDGRTPNGSPNFNLDLTVTVGTTYRLQLLFAETFGGAKAPGQRVFDITAEGSLLVDDLDVWAVGEFTDADGQQEAAVLVEEVFTATDDTYNLLFDPSVDNAYLAGVVLTIVPEPGSMLLVSSGVVLMVMRRR